VELEAGATLALPPVTLDPEAKETGFLLASSPPGAKVFVDGKDTGITTPARLADLPVGTHKVELKNEGHAPWATQVLVSEGQLVELPVAELVAAPAADATEEVAAADEAAAEDDAADEVAPAPTRKLTARQRRIAARRARAARSASAATPKRASASRSARVASSTAAGKAGTGTLRINTRPWSNVFVDGRLVGNTPQMGIQLSAGRHRITLVNKDLGIRKMVEVTIVAGKVETKIITLTP
jgi:serine/threonine-protein kinase